MKLDNSKTSILILAQNLKTSASTTAAFSGQVSSRLTSRFLGVVTGPPLAVRAQGGQRLQTGSARPTNTAVAEGSDSGSWGPVSRRMAGQEETSGRHS